MILLDTRACWWAISEPENLSASAQCLITETPDGQHCVASISLWEFAMMAQRGRIQLTINPQEWLSFAINTANTQVLTLSADIAVESCNLPGIFHKDPADRLIVATARAHHLPLITKDNKIRDYKHVETIW